MTYEQIEKSFLEHFERYGVSMDEDEDTFKFESPEPSVILSFLKQSFIKYLQSEVERLEKSKKTLKNNHPELEEAGMNCECSKCMMDFGKNDGFNQAISDQITHLQAQIKELEA
mgnify:CR=1 FL=1